MYPETATSNLKVKITPLAIGNILVDDMQLEVGKVANYYNLMTNSSFVDGTTGYEIESYKRNGYEWNYGEPTSINPSVEVVNIDGGKALKLVNSPIIQTSVSKPFNISGKAGDVYELSFWYKNEGISYQPTEATLETLPDPAHIAAFLYFNYGDVEDWDGYKDEDILLPYNKDWHFFSKKYVASKDYSDIAFNIQDFFNIDNCYITNISLFKDLESYSYVYDDEGNLVSSVDLSKETSQFAYNSNNQLIQATSPLGKKYKYEYDDNVTDRLIRAISPTGITNAIDYDDNNNPVRTRISNTEAFADIEETNYYIRARGTNAYINIKPDKNLEILENNCSHDKFKAILLPNNRIKLQYTILNNYYLKDNNGVLKVEYGDTNNIFELVKHTNKSYSIKSVTSNLAITVNTDNSLSLTTYNEEDANQQFLFEKMENKLFIESSATYTSDGRFIKTMKDNLGNIVTYDINSINGLTNSITDSNGSPTNYIYDSKLRVTNINKGEHSISYEYDNDNNLSKITHGTKNYIFNYDEFNNPSSVKINNNTLVNNYYEDNNRNLSYIKYGNNHEIHYNYDSLDRLDKVVKQNDTYTNYYDNLNRITKITSNNDTYKYDYDFAKRLSTFKYNDYETNYEYDKENNIIEKTEELGNNKYTYNYEYNEESSLTKLTHSSNIFNYTYDILGRLEEHNINDNYKVKYKYITFGNKTTTVIDEVDDNGTVYNYKYDKLGNITEIYKNNTLTNKYYYDIHSQLIKEDNIVDNKTFIYTYDNYGNILSKKTYTYNTDNLVNEDTYTYEDTNWQDLLTKFNNESITYDTIGNPLTIGNKTLTWMNGRELSSYNDGINNITYKYNSDGIRTSKIVNGIETKYYLEGSSIIFTQTGNDMIYYIYNGDELLGFIFNGNTYYYHKNIFGDILGIMDSNYNEIVTYTYDSWGAIKNIIDNSNINLGTINPFRYRSYYYDEETGLYYLNSRYYNPEWGRFVNADGIIGSNGDAISQNLFAYTSNNFISYSDNDGYGLISSLKKVVSTVKKIVKNTITKLKSITQSNSSKKNVCTYNIASTPKNENYTKVNIKSAKKPSVSRPTTGDPFGVYDIPNGDVRILGPEGTLPGAKDFDGSHHWRHPDLENPHVHDWDELGKRQAPRNPTEEERDWWDNHKKEVGQAAVVGGATVGTAYLIYRGIRMLPSLTPWTWWTIPYNLATP